MIILLGLDSQVCEPTRVHEKDLQYFASRENRTVPKGSPASYILVAVCGGGGLRHSHCGRNSSHPEERLQEGDLHRRRLRRVLPRWALNGH